MKNPYPPSRGFTLIELMITLALAAILMMVAVPSMTTFMRNSQLTSMTNTLLSAINAARGEAMKRGRYAMVVPRDATSWNNGWVVFVDVDRSQSYDAASDITVLKSDAAPSYLTINGYGSTLGSSPYIMFDASGYSRTKAGGFSGGLVLEVMRNDVASSEQLVQTRRLKTSSTGRSRICTPTSAADTSCSTSTSD